MKILQLTKAGEITFILQTIEDLWTLKSVSDKDDVIKGNSYRRQKNELNESKRVPINVSIRIEKVDFSHSLNSLRFTGVIVEGHPIEFAPLGEHHTLEIKLDERYILFKKKLYSYQIDLLKKSSLIQNKVIVVSIDDESASIFELSDIGIKELATIESGKTGKRYNAAAFDFTGFFDEVYSIIAKVTDQIIIAGPGYMKGKFNTYLKTKNNNLKTIEVAIQNTSKSAINELFTKKEVSSFFENSIIFKEQEMLDIFLEYLGKENGKTLYGYKEVLKDVSSGICDYILISERFYKADLDKIQNLIKQAEDTKTKIHIVDNEHDVAKTIDSFGGIISVLRYKKEY